MRYNSLIIAIIFAIAIAVGVMALMASRGRNTENTKDGAIVSSNDGENKKEILTGDFEELYQEAKYMTVEKVVRTMSEDGEGSCKIHYDSYIQSEIDLLKDTDTTIDYSEASVGEGFEVEKGKVSDFASEFSFDYKQKDGLDIYEKLLANEGIDGDLNNTSFDQNTYDKTNQEVYVLNSECSVTKSLLENEQFDEILSSSVSYQVIKTEKGTTIPEFFTATVQFRVGKKIVTKNLYLQIMINNWD